jgi:hypothetical protein
VQEIFFSCYEPFTSQRYRLVFDPALQKPTILEFKKAGPLERALQVEV